MCPYLLGPSLVFPPARLAGPEGLLAVGGDLRPERLILAYSSGIFPWYSSGDPILWWSPPERATLDPRELHLSKTTRKHLRKASFRLEIDTQFARVMKACGKIPRSGQTGTWITPEMRRAYQKLHTLGLAHSFETWLDDSLVGGLYGVSLGGAFFGESMFSQVPEASRFALAGLCSFMMAHDLMLLDCQLENSNVLQFGAQLRSREAYLHDLEHQLRKPTLQGAWSSKPNPFQAPILPDWMDPGSMEKAF